jgi:tetratricopeptide (TPR) repeat protein
MNEPGLGFAGAADGRVRLATRIQLMILLPLMYLSFLFFPLPSLAAREPGLAILPGLSAPGYVEDAESAAWLIPLQNAVYRQDADTDFVFSLYREVRAAAENRLNRVARLVTLSRCEYFLGLHYWFRGREVAAALRFSEGASLASQAINIIPTSGAWCALAENTALLGLVQDTGKDSWARAEYYARCALSLDGNNVRARYLLVARFVFAPAFQNDPRRGTELMEELLLSSGDQFTFPPDSSVPLAFDIYLAIGCGYFQQKRYLLAGGWWEKARRLYPENQSVQNLLDLLPVNSR